nr:LysM peptidoglycan-binding domain-containing protein [Anaerosporobacter faecicola]
MVTYPEKLTSGYYRVRKTWKDSKSQVGAYRILTNAKAAADKNPGTFVFANDGTAIYPVDETSEPNYRIHTVVKGDTLWEIAEQYLGKGARYTEIKKLNGLTSNVIYSGWKLKIPN